MKSVNQFQDKSKNKNIRMIKSAVKSLTSDIVVDNLSNRLYVHYSEVPDTVRNLIVREYSNLELGFATISDYLTAKVIIFNKAIKRDATPLDFAIRLLMEVIGIKLFKIDTRKYISMSGEYENAEMLFDCVSLNYKEKDVVDVYTTLVESRIMNAYESNPNISEREYAIVCDSLDTMYWRSILNSMVLKNVDGFENSVKFYEGRELFIDDIDFSSRNSINPETTIIKVFDRDIKIREVIINGLHFILGNSGDESVVIPTQFPTEVSVKDVILVGAILQYYKLKENGIRYNMPQGVKDDNKVTRVNKKAKSREEMLAVQNKWNFSIGEDETIFRKALLN